MSTQRNKLCLGIMRPGTDLYRPSACRWSLDGLQTFYPIHCGKRVISVAACMHSSFLIPSPLTPAGVPCSSDD